MLRRLTAAAELVDWVGSDRLSLVKLDKGWPSHFTCHTKTGKVPLAVHLSPITLSKRKRDFVERRFQNPGQNRPVVAASGEYPIMLGYEEISGQRVLVGMDGEKRLGKRTRQSLFMPVNLLPAGIAKGWEEHVSTAKERIVAFVPPLLPFFVETYRSGQVVSRKEIREALKEAGVNPLPPDA